ncbi:MAG: hypothetical protein WCS73_05180 [Lentisphaeria bacterium]
MTDQEYKELLIKMVSISDHHEKEEVISLLKICNFTFKKTGEFSGKVWNQRKKEICLSIIPDKFVQLKSHSVYIEGLCHEIYPVSDEYMLSKVNLKPGPLADYENVSQEVQFENIQKKLLMK